ncbi:hypothetical protein [Herbiconiux liangxiaofengii]|uniref:hypothetical protein n=1 Tax=Herbiconiux liangxiaofengii TaxID=3342795 RepID=UPI0035B75517
MTTPHAIRPSTTDRAAATGDLVWGSPESKLWVASRDGEFAGFVEFVDGHYATVDGTGQSLPPRATLAEAKAALANGGVEPGRPRGARLLALTAVGCAGAALTSLAVALHILPL